MFARVIQALEAAKTISQEMKTVLSSDLEKAQHAIENQLGLVLETMDDATAPLLKEAEKIRRRKGREAAGGMQAKRSRTADARTASGTGLDPHLLTGGSKC